MWRKGGVAILVVYVALQLISVRADLAYGEVPYARTLPIIVAGGLIFLLAKSIRGGRAHFMGWRHLGATLLVWFATVWFVGIAVLVLVSWIGIFVRAGNVWDGIGAWQEAVSPFNLGNYIVLMLLLAPGIGATWLAEKLKG